LKKERHDTQPGTGHAMGHDKSHLGCHSCSSLPLHTSEQRAKADAAFGGLFQGVTEFG
jgi:hypothetical protein